MPQTDQHLSDHTCLAQRIHHGHQLHTAQHVLLSTGIDDCVEAL